MNLALDKSLRKTDENGYLHIETSHISKATVNPYYGREIPGYAELGLDPDEIYQVYRPAEELEKAAATFNRLPILSEHIPLDAADYAAREKQATIGATGDNAKFSDPYLDNSLTIWDKTFIDAIENDSQREISCAYRYTPKKEVGEFDGKPYTLVMTDIRGNHVAIVKEGRAGSDVLVADTAIKPRITMKLLSALKKMLGIAMDSKHPKQAVAKKALMALDEEGIDPEGLENTLLDTMKDINAQESADPDEGVATDDNDFLNALKAFIEQYEKGQQQAAPDVQMAPAGAAGDEEPDEEDDKDEEKPAMDAASIRAEVRKELQAEITAKAKAAAKVQPLVGQIDAMSFDSVPDIYRMALEAHGVNVAGHKPEAYASMVDMLLRAPARPNITITQDSGATQDVMGQFPSLTKIKTR